MTRLPLATLPGVIVNISAFDKALNNDKNYGNFKVKNQQDRNRLKYYVRTFKNCSHAKFLTC